MAFKNIKSPAQIQLAAFKKEVTKLQVQNAKLEAESFTLKARIKILEAERKFHEPPTPTDRLDLAMRAAFLLASAGMHIVDSEGNKIEP